MDNIDMYNKAIAELNLMIHAERETLRMMACKYEGEVSEETREVERRIEQLCGERDATKSLVDETRKQQEAELLMLRQEDD